LRDHEIQSMVAVQAMLTFTIAGLFLGALGAGRDRSQRGDSGKRRSRGDRPAKGDIRGGIGINPCFGHLLGFRATAG
jgi:hypothetical protein